MIPSLWQMIANFASGELQSRENRDFWGKVRSGGISQTTLNYTGQHLDGTDLLYYHARYYDPKLSRFVSPDSIVPGIEDGKGGAADSIGAVQNHKLTVDFHEPGFISSVQKEHDLTLEKGFWFQLKEEDRKDQKDPWGPANPQALNRYAYVMNNPVRYTDPTGHIPPLLALGVVLAGGIGSGVAIDAGIDYATASDKANFDWGASARNSLKDPLTYVGAVPIGKLAKVGKISKLGMAGKLGRNLGKPTLGAKVYRVWGGKSRPWGQYWSRVDPRSVSNYRYYAGIGEWNTGRFVSEGYLRDISGVAVTPGGAARYGKYAGGIDELKIPYPESQIELTRVSGANPEY